MKTYRIASAPMIHTPGVFAWITQSVMPFDTPKALELLQALGLPIDAANAVTQGLAKWRTEGETQIVEIP